MTSDTTKVGMIPPPEGVTTDFSGNKTGLQHRIIVVYATVTALSTLVLGLRLYTRIFIRRMTGLEDWLIVLSWVGCVAWLAVCFDAFQYGFGEHQWNVTLEMTMNYLRLLIGIMVVYVWTPALTKLSLLALYHRLNPDRTTQACVYALAFLVVGYSVAITIVVTGPCNPQTHTDQQCLTDINLWSEAPVMGVINILTDFFILCLPMPMVRRLQLPTKQKIFLGLIFALGSGVIIISTVRIIYVYHLVSDPDVTYNQAAACIFSAVELNGGVICACSALLKPFFQRHMPWVLSLSSGSRSRSRSKILGIFGKRSGKSYELHSVEAKETSKPAGSNAENQIAVTTTYSIQGTKKGKGEGDSTEDLFTPSSKGWNGVV
ncbi:hypothetical protein BKA66DRAFT_414976 [Pyrenochaeta sp. MPI-SDFR-AT-0127]|nr:hypothetical protein BKA66DRAFT_414976 [Pyrenochaeta sp. MPI-SDFR-AT-0127]